MVVPDVSEVYRRGRVVDRIAGFRILEVTDESTAAEAGFEPRDFLYDIGGQSFENADQLEGYLSSADYDRGVRIKVIRDQAQGYIDLKKE